MACFGMADNLTDAIKDAAAKPKLVTVDGVTTQFQTLPELIAADKHLATRSASVSPFKCLGFAKLSPPGGVSCR